MARLVIITLVALMLNIQAKAQQKPRVVVSTDIGGTDDDDFQSMIHYLMYSDRFQTEGLISSPYGEGRKADILRIIDLYEEDYQKLKAHKDDFPAPDELRHVTKQGGLDRAPLKGWGEPSEGSEWIVHCARKEDEQPLWLLVWGGLEDLAQALHDAPDIAEKLRIYWIGGPNKKWSADAYQYVATHFPDLWMIEANSTYRGWFVDDGSDKGTNVRNYYQAHIRGRGAMGRDFINYYEGVVKMGDTPAVAYLLHGDIDDPAGKSWGGSFVPMGHSSRRVFDRPTSRADTAPVFSMMEWKLAGPAKGVADEEPCLMLEIDGQQFEGYYEGGGQYRVRFVTKSTGVWNYRIISPLNALDGIEGSFVSVDPWPAPRHVQDFGPLRGWWTDDPGRANFQGQHQGAKTVFRYQEEFLLDWALRWGWLE